MGKGNKEEKKGKAKGSLIRISQEVRRADSHRVINRCWPTDIWPLE